MASDVDPDLIAVTIAFSAVGLFALAGAFMPDIAALCRRVGRKIRRRIR